MQQSLHDPIGGNIEFARQISINLGDIFDACPKGKLEKVDDEWWKSDRKGDVESYEHSFLDEIDARLL